MRTLKSIIYVYEETIAIKGHNFKYVEEGEIKQGKDSSIFSLYDSEKYEKCIALTIKNYDGLIKIAEAYLTGNKKDLEEAKKQFCIVSD